MNEIGFGLTLIDCFVVLGVVAVLPLAMGGPWWGWAAAALTTVAAFREPVGVPAAVLAVPLVALGGVVALGRLRSFDGIGSLAGVYTVVASGSLVLSRLGVELLGVGEPIVELTAVHYIFAGAGALTLAAHARQRADRPWTRRLAAGAVRLTAIAPPVVALGFVAGQPLPQVGGAVLMTSGVWLTGTLHLAGAVADRREHPAARVLLGLSGLAIWAPMVLAVAWAAGQHWSVPALSVDDMARTHGAANALAFILAGLVARHPCWRRGGEPVGSHGETTARARHQR